LWFGIWAPAGTPANIVREDLRGHAQALADPGVRERLGNLGNDTMDMSPEEFARFRAQRTHRVRARSSSRRHQAAVMPQPVARAE